MANELRALMQEVVASPLGDVIASVGEGVAAAQMALDEASVAKTLEIYAEGGGAMVAMLREIGYRPTFYVLPETTGEVSVSLRLAGGNSPAPAQARGRVNPLIASKSNQRVRTYVTPVDAGFANRYSYSANVSARLTFKIVPVPPPEGMDRARVMPNLVGQELASALLVLEMLDLVPRLVDAQGAPVESPVGTVKVNKTVPEAGAIVSTDIDVTVTV